MTKSSIQRNTNNNGIGIQGKALNRFNIRANRIANAKKYPSNRMLGELFYKRIIEARRQNDINRLVQIYKNPYRGQRMSATTFLNRLNYLRSENYKPKILGKKIKKR